MQVSLGPFLFLFSQVHQKRFNIWNTGPDLNFDRITHLSKLVFNTKGATISLVDGNEQ